MCPIITGIYACFVSVDKSQKLENSWFSDVKIIYLDFNIHYICYVNNYIVRSYRFVIEVTCSVTREPLKQRL